MKKQVEKQIAVQGFNMLGDVSSFVGTSDTNEPKSKGKSALNTVSP